MPSSQSLALYNDIKRKFDDVMATFFTSDVIDVVAPSQGRYLFFILINCFRAVVVENKEYNYTLIITGEHIQIIHHDSQRNLTFNHGIQVIYIDLDSQRNLTFNHGIQVVYID